MDYFLFWKNKVRDSPPLSEYDFIIVGGGSAGCALASRLSENPSITVLLIEAGGEGRHLDSRIPAACGKLQHTQVDWEDYAEPQEGRAGLGMKEGKIYWPRGKGLGGSSIINYMAYVRGNPADFNSWAEILGDSKWAWDSVSSIYQRMENCSTLTAIDTKLRGMDGPVSVSMKFPINPIAQNFVDRVAAMGHEVGDYNGASQERVSIHQTTTKNGSRWTAADAYIWPILADRGNLHVVLNTHVNRVCLERNGDAFVASGVEISPQGRDPPFIIRAAKEVIVCASAVGSPHLLLLSGIGPREDLERLNITCLVDSPEVGKNLNDHLLYPIICRGRRQSSSGSTPDNSPFIDIGSVNKAKAESIPSLFEWSTKGTGFLSSSAYDASLFHRTGLNPDYPFPDSQISMFCGILSEREMIDNFNRPTDVFPSDIWDPAVEGFIVVPTLLHPRSTGQITLRSKNPLDKPVIEPGYLSDPRDVDTLAAIVMYAFDIVKNLNLGDPILTSIFDGQPLSTDLCKELIRAHASTIYHPTSTLAMGKVLDSSLRVLGVKGLRVADASAFPHVTSGNTNAPSIMIGEMAASIIRAEYQWQ